MTYFLSIEEPTKLRRVDGGISHKIKMTRMFCHRSSSSPPQRLLVIGGLFCLLSCLSLQLFDNDNILSTAVGRDVWQTQRQRRMQEEVVTDFPEMIRLPPSSSSSSSSLDTCKTNAIVYVTQKVHSSYKRDSFGIMQRSLDLLYKNYLMIDGHYRNADVFLFHEGDVTAEDLDMLESKQDPAARGTMRLVNLADSPYWQVPEWLRNDNQTEWRGSQRYSVGYRHMMRWYSLQLWNYFADLNDQRRRNNNNNNNNGGDCSYKYIMRMDEESFILSPIQYDLFDFMKSNNYAYGFRLCSYELGPGSHAWLEYQKHKKESENQQIKVHSPFFGRCGFYNNFFIAELDFFRSEPVQDFLNWVDRAGYIYRSRTSDLVLQSIAVYSFCPPERIHRFLDFTYEHFTFYPHSGCPWWGGIQAGYNDAHGRERIQNWARVHVNGPKCQVQTPNHPYAVRVVELTAPDLSPTFTHHLPPHLVNNKNNNGQLQLLEVAAGLVDLAGKGRQSG